MDIPLSFLPNAKGHDTKDRFPPPAKTVIFLFFFLQKKKQPRIETEKHILPVR